jgi:hypothetical protein
MFDATKPDGTGASPSIGRGGIQRGDSDSDAVCMSRSATPSARNRSITAAIALEFSAIASAATGPSVVTPTMMVALSGSAMTCPVPMTVMRPSARAVVAVKKDGKKGCGKAHGGSPVNLLNRRAFVRKSQVRSGRLAFHRRKAALGLVCARARPPKPETGWSMTPSFALDLAPDGIRLLYRAEGGWTVVGDASPEDPNLDDRLAALRADAEALAPGAVTTDLVIPPCQILYASLTREPDQPLTEEALRPRLEGLTPLRPEELAFDWAEDGDTIRLAILDRNTLAEAEEFARAHGFKPLCFSARPTPRDFPRDPDFGACEQTQDAGAAVPLPAVAPAKQAPAPAPEPEAPAEPAAEELARSLTAPRPAATDDADALTLFSLRGRRSPEAEARSTKLRLRVAAGVAVAGLVWAAYFGIRSDGPTDPAAVLPDTPPAVALTAPDLAPPDVVETALAASEAPGSAGGDTAPAQPGLAVVAVPAPETATEPEADLAAPAAMEDENPASRHAASKPWPRGPETPASPVAEDIEGLYVASIDPVTRASDAVALLPSETLAAGPRPAAPLPPPPAGTTFDLDDRGFVRATPDGAFTPEGLVVRDGAPPLRPPSAPARAAETGLEPTETALALPDLRPRPRPGGLVERNERVTLGGRTRDELGGLRPLPRPESAQAVAQAAVASTPPSDQAVASSIAPRDRPEDFAVRVATARAVAAAMAEAPPVPAATPAPAAAPAPQVAAVAAPADAADYDDGEPEIVAAAPNIPTSASVSRQATIQNAIRLREINLIGVYGTDRDRRALVRMPNGRYVKVKVGDRLDGGQIAAIGRNQLRYVKGGRNITLSVPSG